MRIKFTLKTIFILIVFLFSAHVNAANLLQVYRQALKSDPTFKAAEAQYLAATQLYPQARALLLPNILVTAETGYNRFEAFRTGFFGLNPKVENFPNNQIDITFSQPIIDFGAFYNLKDADFQVKSAAATFAAAAQDLMTRTAFAYFDVLQAEDTLRFTQAEKEATAKQLDQAEQRFKVGLDAITSVYNAQATYDSIIAQEITAKNDVLNAKERLREITGIYYNNLAKLKPGFPLITPNPINVERWVEASEKQNFEVVAARFTAASQRENIQVQFAGYLPTLNLVSSYNRTQSNLSGDIAVQDTAQGRVGLSLNMPIYQGGLITANTKQAEYQYEQSLQDLEQTYRRVMVNTRQTYNNVIAGISRVKADRQTVVSQQASYDSTAAALKVGTRTIVDLLIVQQQLFDAQRQLAVDQYAYINDVLTLKQLAGTLSYKDIEVVNTWLYTGGRIKQPYSGRLPAHESPAKPLLYYPKKYRDPLDNVKEEPEALITQTKNKHEHNKTHLARKQHKNPPQLQLEGVKTTNHAKSSRHAAHHPTNKPTLQFEQKNNTAQINTAAILTKMPHKSNLALKPASRKYTIQLLADKDKAKVINFAKRNQLSTRTKVYKTSVNGKPWYVLLYGNYKSSHQARTDLQNLPKQLTATKPWVRKVPKAVG
ncbi:MAG: TolC family outer membrane protein [Pseudomonadota bacterium]